MYEMTEYTITKATSTDQLALNVTGLMREGWKPFGSLVLDPGYHGVGEAFIQPMGKWEKKA